MGLIVNFFLLIGLRADLAVIETLEKFLDLFSVQTPTHSGIPLCQQQTSNSKLPMLENALCV